MVNYTIIIVNWNSWSELSLCLLALSKQTYKAFKVIISDNASTCAAPVGIFSCLKDYLYVQNKYNYGFSQANNKLIELAGDSKWIIFLNPDAFPEPDWLEKLITASRSMPDYSIFGSRLINYREPDKLDGDGDAYHISGLAWRFHHGMQIHKADNKNHEVFSVCAAAAMFPTNAVRQVGGFDPDYFCYFEDVDLCFRLRLVGYRCLFVPSAVVRHVGSASTGGKHSDFAVYYGHRNMVWTYIKNMPISLLWLFLPYHILLNICSIIYFTIKGKSRTILKAKFDALRYLPKIWRKRKIIHSKCKVSAIDIVKRMKKAPILKR